MKLARPARAASLISLVPMIDVLLILLVFFMVTSTYLNLDMIPATAPETSARPPGQPAADTPRLMIRLGADGAPALQGQSYTLQTLRPRLAAALAEEPLTQVLILPSGAASTQALVSLLDLAAELGVQQLRVLRLEAEP
ncbi:biopolymer transporter ExbD [Phaeobacter sp. HF9A]|uniref:ExbD/TolR family protein n=1 Tax=Phaeobacter sp. HF9A TaxID=2721561 RepID=UPI001431EF6C|nr:biopolymer transporter ExbD [Phaeobacter sp. HF9A]NIZ13166.1 biopolymer transporter ExbD [Phaeobacter sp. HF9A]